MEKPKQDVIQNLGDSTPLQTERAGSGCKRYPTEVLLSISTGVLLCTFSDMHECVEFLTGRPVWTHQFAHDPFAKELSRAVLSQHPQLATVDTSEVTTHNWEAFKNEQVLKFGPSLSLMPSDSWRTLGRSFSEPLEGKPVLFINPSGEPAQKPVRSGVEPQDVK